MYLKKNAGFNRKFYFNMSGITIKAVGSRLRDFSIDEVREGSLAYEAGVRSGDRIIEINGISTKTMNLKIINSYFNSRPGKRIKITVMRDGEKKIYKFRLSSAI